MTELIRIQNEYTQCTIRTRSDGRLDIQGTVTSPSRYDRMELVAPNSYMSMMNYSVSALPYPCASVAFENTPNRMTVAPKGEFHTVFSYPNAYYGTDTLTKVPPSVFLILTEGTNDPLFIQMKLPDPFLLRTLTYREGRREKGPLFYWEKRDLMDVTTQETILRNIGRIKEVYHVA